MLTLARFLYLKEEKERSQNFRNLFYQYNVIFQQSLWSVYAYIRWKILSNDDVGANFRINVYFTILSKVSQFCEWRLQRFYKSHLQHCKIHICTEFCVDIPSRDVIMCVGVKSFQFRHKIWDELTTAWIEFPKTVKYLTTLWKYIHIVVNLF